MTPTIDVTLDRPRHLRYQIRDLLHLEKVVGKPLGAILREWGELSVDSLSAVLWAGLKHEDKKLTQDDALKLIQTFLDDGGDIIELRKAMNEALLASGYFGPQQDNGGRPGPPEPSASG